MLWVFGFCGFDFKLGFHDFFGVGGVVDNGFTFDIPAQQIKGFVQELVDFGADDRFFPLLFFFVDPGVLLVDFGVLPVQP